MAYREVYYIVINGVETNRRVRQRDANYIAWVKRQKHGAYNVWIRPRKELVVA